MGDLTTSIERPAAQLPTFTVPSLRLPRFEQGNVIVERPAAAARPTITTLRAPMASPAAPTAPIAPTAPTHVAPIISPAATASFMPYAAPVAAQGASHERLAHLRRDAMLGLVLGIAAAVVAASFVLAMWVSMHGDPPGLH